MAHNAPNDPHDRHDGNDPHGGGPYNGPGGSGGGPRGNSPHNAPGGGSGNSPRGGGSGPVWDTDPLDAEWEALMGPPAPGTPFAPRRKTPSGSTTAAAPAGARPGPEDPSGPGHEGPEGPGGPAASALAALDELAKPPTTTAPRRGGPLARLLHRARPTRPAHPWQHWFYTSAPDAQARWKRRNPASPRTVAAH